jgi:hypothetical protein
MVALNGCLLELNSGESLALAAGDVILLEDALKPGHKVKPLEHNDLRVLYLTLPDPYYHTGKEHLSLPASFVLPTTKKGPCPNNPYVIAEVIGQPKEQMSLVPNTVWTAQRIRRVCLGIFGLSVSTLAADFMGKTAPLWLAVGIGGTSFVVAVTWSVVTGGDALLSHLIMLLEKRKLDGVPSDLTPPPDMESVATL